MSVVKTLQIRIVNPMVERLIDDLASLDLIEIDESETVGEETPLEQYDRWCRECDERRKREGPPYEDPPLSMEKIVAICKEVRAEMYEEKQKIANCR
jgi:hypothetical protein